MNDSAVEPCDGHALDRPCPSGAELTISALERHGITDVFGLISVHTLPLHDALRSRARAVRYIGARSESGMAFMADGYARASGRLGVLVSSSGPGAAHTLAGMGEAYFAGSPLLQLTTNVATELLDRELHATHEPRHQLQMFESVAGWTARACSVPDIPFQIDRACDWLRTHRPRPCVLEIPHDLLAARAACVLEPPSPSMPRQARADALERAAALLSRARCPLVLVGEELSDGAATDELVALARLLRAPVACTEGACGAMPADDPAMLGPAVAGRHWGENPLLGFARRCDATVVLGSSLPYRSTLSIGLELPRPLVHVSLDERALGRTYDADVCIHADARLVLPRLRQLLETRPLAAATATANAAEIESVRRAIHDRLATSWPGSVRAFAAIREVLPRDATTVWDPAAITFRALRCFPAYLPRTLLWTHGWQGLGFSLPAAIGARLAQPHREAICFAGDGGFQYNLQELATLRQLGASVAMVVVNDDAWGALKAYQRKNYGGRYFGVDLTNPDFVALAEAYGIEGVRVRTVAELCRALDHHIGSERPHLIEVDAPHGIEGLAPG